MLISSKHSKATYGITGNFANAQLFIFMAWHLAYRVSIKGLTF